MPPKEAPKKFKIPKGPKPIHHKQKNTIGLGKAIIYQRSKENTILVLPDGESRFATDKKDADWVKLRSVTQESHIDDFLNSAALANKDFTAVRRNQISIIGESSQPTNYLLSEEKTQELNVEILKNQNKLVVPRRPTWDESTTKAQLQDRENKSFLQWRRELALLQKENDDLLLTPFERNLEVWRQLWRVVERSDLVVQIVDARNPLSFRSVDLENYVKELNPKKKNLLLVNKADLLSLKQRAAWAKYFIEHDIPYAFFSAGKANELLDKQRQELEDALLDTKYNNMTKNLFKTSLDEDNDEKEEKSHNINEDKSTAETIEKQVFNTNSKDLDEKVRILSIDELEDLFLTEAPEPLTKAPNPNEKPKLQIGLVGYPNVGKSSTINALVGSKRVSVSSTPGKTKHFQTILLSDDIILCDCPGLVFPNFAHTNAELVCNGVLPIDQLRESIGPTQLVAQRIPKFFLEAIYGIAIPTKSTEDGGDGIPTAQELLNAYARARGYMTQGFGSADESRAARYILKDYVNGKLLFVNPPPNPDGTSKSLKESLDFNKDIYTINLLSENRQKQIVAAINASDEFDLDTFSLAEDLNKLSFSSHIGANNENNNKSDTRFYGGKQAALHSASDEINADFFKLNNVNGVLSNPFHLKNGDSNGGKKHKKGKKLKVRNMRN